MPFHFSLQAILHLRQSLERQHELRLRAANQLVARVQRLIAQLDERQNALRGNQAQALHAGTTVAELRFTLSCESMLLQQRRDLERELTRLQKLRDEQQKVFQYARLQRETLASLRARQLHEYEREAARRQQRQLDDLFLLRRAYLQRG
jgi:flagellar export protein FliJ